MIEAKYFAFNSLFEIPGAGAHRVEGALQALSILSLRFDIAKGFENRPKDYTFNSLFEIRLKKLEGGPAECIEDFQFSL